MTQKKYPRILEENKLSHGHINDTLIDDKLTMNENDPRIEVGLYKKLISKLLYLAHTCPNISYLLVC